jgi:hypothetical protein
MPDQEGLKVIRMAEEIVRNKVEVDVEQSEMKRKAKEVIDWYNLEGLRDIVVIFVTDSWHADTFWQKMSVEQTVNVMEALKEGLEEAEEVDEI